MWNHAAIRRARLCVVLSLLLPAIATADSTTSTAKPASSNKPSSASTPHPQKTQSTTTHHAAGKSASKAGHSSSTHSATVSHNRTSAKTSGSTTGKRSSLKKSASKRKAAKRGQQVIDSGRAREIQEALIREHYLEGEPSGTWDSATQAAMQRYQEAQGWQSKTIPDSRALIKLGLGPSNDHLLNPDSAMTSAAGEPKAESKQAPTDPAVPQR
jgi:hypothetical protein